MDQAQEFEARFDQQLGTAHNKEPGATLHERMGQKEKASDQKPNRDQKVIESPQSLISSLDHNVLLVKKIEFQGLILLLNKTSP